MFNFFFRSNKKFFGQKRFFKVLKVLKKLDWRDGGEGKKKGRRGGILLCNGLIKS